ncbi:MAG TPA: NAD+ synthase [Acidimicrobiales bacterium]|nr:NAD+ synthase [Acidimicrobiales bacterium]
MVTRLRIAACQINTVVGDLDGNVARIVEALGAADDAGCDLAVFPELAVTGYPPEDLLLKPGFVVENRQALARVASASATCAAVVGFVDADRDLYNAVAVCSEGQIQGTYRKRLLPNYAVFDEKRYFAPGTGPPTLFRIGGVKVGISICEDAWSPSGPILVAAAGGAEMVVNLNASPYYAGRLEERLRMLATRAADASCPLVYVNQVGGQDELVFDGGSVVFDQDGRLYASAPQFVEDVMIFDLEVVPAFHKRLLDPRGHEVAEPLPEVVLTAGPRANAERRLPVVTAPLAPEDEIYEALVLGTRDYVGKNGFSDVVLGMSGGIDSSLVATIAVDALGADHVHGVAMPSRFSSEGSLSDAGRLAANLGIELRTIPIEAVHAAMLEVLAPSFAGTDEGVAEENIQGRIRATLLMALNNKFNWLVLICGNKSELAVGYTTIYGVDMAGGFAVIKDVPKTLVYRLAEARNRRAGHDLIPRSVMDKPPSAELRPGQRDDQSLPPYEILDPIVQAYVEADRTLAELVAEQDDPDLVRRVARMIDRAEWKRRQAPPGVRVTSKAFGKDRRVPITNRYPG